MIKMDPKLIKWELYLHLISYVYIYQIALIG